MHLELSEYSFISQAGYRVHFVDFVKQVRIRKISSGRWGMHVGRCSDNVFFLFLCVFFFFFFFFLVINAFLRGQLRTSFEKQLDPMGPIAPRGGSAPIYLWKHIATCDFLGDGVGVMTPCPPSGSAHVKFTSLK